MIVDSSALITILNEEPFAARCLDALLTSRMARISAANVLVATIVADRHPTSGLGVALDELIARLGLIIEPVNASQIAIAREAYQRIGRGSGHPARLNLGDCFAYTLTKELDVPLLFIGQDFAHTDLRGASSSEPVSVHGPALTVNSDVVWPGQPASMGVGL